MLRPHDQQVIAALASGSGPGAVGVIRVSGENSWAMLRTCFPHASTALRPRFATLQKMLDPKTSEILDEVVLLYFKGPKSFTGQDTLEIYCHGGPYIIRRILSTIYALGARPAEPGEFTKRALLNGKLDLTAAEGIKDLVEAESRQQWVAGRQLYQGKLREEIEGLRREIIGALAYLEAMIDFPDEGDTQNTTLDAVRTRVQSVLNVVHGLSSTINSGKIASRGLMVALAGAPNAGKSTLLNTLLGKDRAIVSEIAGTTRDYIEEPCLIDGRLIRLVDTAGIRETNDIIEQHGISLSTQLVREADVVLALKAADSSDDESSCLDRVLSNFDKPIITVMTKCDLARPAWGQKVLQLSCKSGDGLPELRNTLANIVDNATGDLEERPFITSSRHFDALAKAENSLRKFQSSDQASAGHEMLAFELQEAARALSSIVGDISSEDILDKIFSDFCIGK